MTYLTTKVPNFAHADFVIVGVYSSSTAYILWNVSSPYLTAPLSLIFGGLTAVVMYLAVLKPLIKRGSSLVVLMIATLAVDIIFVGVFDIFIEYMDSKFGRIMNDRGYGGELFSLQQLPDFQFLHNVGLLYVAPITLAAVTLGIYLLLTRSKFGVAMRAAIENTNLAKTVGINVERVNLVAWFLSGGIAGLAGGLLAIFTGTPNGSASLYIVDIFAGSVLGGLGSVYGAIIGGLIIGASEIYLISVINSWYTTLFPTDTSLSVLNLQRGIPLAIMVIVLLFAPQGLTGVNWHNVAKKIRILK